MTELNWYDNYYNQSFENKLICNPCSKTDKELNFEIDKVLSLFEKVESQNKIIEIEKEYSESLDRIEELYGKDNLDEYLNSKNSKILLKEELDIIRLLSKYTLQNNYIDYKFFFKSIKLLFKISEILRVKNKSR